MVGSALASVCTGEGELFNTLQILVIVAEESCKMSQASP